MKCLQVGLVGFGFAGRIFHSSVIEAVEGLELAAIVQRSGNSAATAFPHVKIVPSVDALLQDTSIRLVVVATPNATHLPIARQCLLAGRDVVVDKPFTIMSHEAHQLAELARAEDAFALTGLIAAAALFGSAILAFALRRGELTAEAAFELSRLDEIFQEERWGVDAEAAARADAVAKEAVSLGQWFRSLDVTSRHGN